MSRRESHGDGRAAKQLIHPVGSALAQAYLDRAQAPVWDEYSPRAVARRFLGVVASVQNP